MILTSGLDLAADGDDFVLSVTQKDGEIIRVKLTSDQVLTLSQSAPRFREQILSKLHPSPGNIESVLATPVAQIGLNTDSLDEDILLTMIGRNGGRLVYAVPAHIAQHLVDSLPKWISKLKVIPTKQ